MWRVSASPICGAAVLGLALLALSGCGGNGNGSASSSSSSSLPGAKVFDSAGCGGCHTLAAAKSKGTVGPNLDQLRPDHQRVELQVRNGGVSTDVYIIAAPETNLRKLGHSVQRRVREALDQMVGIPADQVNVYVEDVSE